MHWGQNFCRTKSIDMGTREHCPAKWLSIAYYINSRCLNIPSCPDFTYFTIIKCCYDHRFLKIHLSVSQSIDGRNRMHCADPSNAYSKMTTDKRDTLDWQSVPNIYSISTNSFYEEHTPIVLAWVWNSIEAEDLVFNLINK